MHMKYILTCLLVVSFLNGIKAQEKELRIIDSLVRIQEHANIVGITDSLLSTIDSENPHYYDILLKRAFSYQAQNVYEKAIPDWLELIKARPDTTDYYNSLAFAYWSLNNIPEAISTVEKAYKIDSNDILTLSNLGYFKALNQDYKSCIKYTTEGLKNKNLNDQQKGLLHSNRSNGFIGLKKYKKAESEATKAIKYFPKNSFAYYYRAIARFGLSKPEKACIDMKKSKELGAINMTSEWLEIHCN